MIKKFLVLILIFSFLHPTEGHARKHKKKIYRAIPTAMSAVLWDVSNNKFLYAKNIDRKVYPASTTKIMTAILALERLNLDQYVMVNASALQVPETTMDLKPGQQYKVRDLLYGILLKSANDAANVLAEAVAGSQVQFVNLMNQRAAQLGATHTKFANAHGLPSDRKQYCTARDMALIMRQALKYTFFREAITYKYRIVYSKEGTRSFLKSHNKTLFMDWKMNIFGKTGFTQQAQSCFVGYYRNNGRTFIVNVFGCRKRWEDLKYIVERFGRVNL